MIFHINSLLILGFCFCCRVVGNHLVVIKLNILEDFLVTISIFFSKFLVFIGFMLPRGDTNADLDVMDEKKNQKQCLLIKCSYYFAWQNTHRDCTGTEKLNKGNATTRSEGQNTQILNGL